MSNLNDFTNTVLKYNTQQELTSFSQVTAEQSAAFQSDTVAIAIACVGDSSSTTSVHFDIGVNPTATTSSVAMPVLASGMGGSNSQFGGNYLVLGVNAGEKISCMRKQGYTMEAHIIELKY